MSNAPSPEVVAAIPTVVNAIKLLQAALNTTLTGDPLQIPARASAAFLIFEGQLGLLLPGLASSEASAVNTDVQSRFTGLISKLEAYAASGAAPAAAPVT